MEAAVESLGKSIARWTDKGDLFTSAVPGPALFRREIICRLLVRDQGARLRLIASTGSRSHQISRAIDWLKSKSTSPLQIVPEGDQLP